MQNYLLSISHSSFKVKSEARKVCISDKGMPRLPSKGNIKLYSWAQITVISFPHPLQFKQTWVQNYAKFTINFWFTFRAYRGQWSCTLHVRLKLPDFSTKDIGCLFYKIHNDWCFKTWEGGGSIVRIAWVKSWLRIQRARFVGHAIPCTL